MRLTRRTPRPAVPSPCSVLALADAGFRQVLPDRCTGGGHVCGDRIHECTEIGELAHTAEPLNGLHLDLLAVQVTREVQEVRFDGARDSVERRVGPYGYR